MSDDTTRTWEETGSLPPRTIPDRIGRYRLIRLIGEGGMGIVYEAEQDQPRRIVALKLVRPDFVSASAVRRLELESEVLGRLQHPGIAQIFEAGMADAGSGPQPFFAMELVQGLPLTDYADQAGLGVGPRLELLTRICDAVHHAHQRGVIHRDLKPGNILVDRSGQPKVLDFGLARLTDVQQTTRHTRYGQILGTVPYMSPEQVSGDPGAVDTRSDVYALGVILYELMARRLPLDLNHRPLTDAVRTIVEAEPGRLGTLNRAFRGDIETIAAKALEKEPARRYASAAALSEDLRRHLRHEPIEARPASVGYQIRKFARRNRVLVGAVVAVVAVLTAGVIAATWQAVRASREAAKATAVQGFLQEMLASADPLALEGSRDVTVREVLNEAAKRVDAGSLAGQPDVEAVIRTTLGRTFRALGLYTEAEPHLKRALELQRSGSAAAGAGLATSLIEMGELLDFRGESAAAEPLYREALLIRRREFGEDHTATAEVLTKLGALLHGNGDLAEAEPLLRKAVAIQRREFGDLHPDLADSLDFLGRVLLDRGDLAGAEPFLREALSIRRAALPASHPLIASSINNLGLLLRLQGDLKGAESLFREAWETQRRDLGEDHPMVAKSLSNIAVVLRQQGDLAGAEPLARQALSSLRSSLGADHALIASTLGTLGGILQDKGDATGAEQSYREALTICRRALPQTHPDLALSLDNLGTFLMEQGDLAGAEPLYREALAIRQSLGASTDVAQSMNNLASLLGDTGHPEEAESLYRQALSVLQQALGQDHPDVAISKSNLAWILASRGDHAAAEPLFRDALATFRKALGDRHVNVASTLENLGRTLEAQEDLNGAERLFREALSIRVEVHGADDPAVASTSLHLARVLGRRGSFAEAERLARDSLRIRKAAFPATHWSRFDAMSSLGAIFAEQKRFAEAESMLLEGQRGVSDDPSAPARARQASLKRLVSLYEAWGKSQEAARWRARQAAEP